MKYVIILAEVVLCVIYCITYLHLIRATDKICKQVKIKWVRDLFPFVFDLLMLKIGETVGDYFGNEIVAVIFVIMANIVALIVELVYLDWLDTHKEV